MFHQLPQHQPISIIVAVAEVVEKQTKTGKKYHAVTFIARDQTRQIVNFWEGSPPPPAIGTVVKLRATWSTGDFGLEAKNITLLTPSEEDVAEFAKCFIRPESTHAKNVILHFIHNLITDPLLKDMLMWLWQTHGAAYQSAAAARSNHQPYAGGLMEHTAAMLLLAQSLTEQINSETAQVFYQNKVNPSLIYTAIIFHDCGKMWENNFTPAAIPCHMPYNRIAEYHGHIAIGHALAIEAFNATQSPGTNNYSPFPNFPDVIHHLCHCILSHHGQIEWGSPIEPKSLEAHIVHSVDNIEAKTWMHTNNIMHGNPLPDNLHKNNGPIRITISPMERGL